MNSQSSNPLLPYPGLRGRVFLDYPLDILLNRECSLKAHEAGLVPLLAAYESAVEQTDSAIRETLAKHIRDDCREAATDRQTERWTDGVLDWGLVKAGKARGFRDDHSRRAFEEDLDRLKKESAESAPEILRLHLLLRDRVPRECQLQREGNVVLEMLRDYKNLSNKRPVRTRKARTITPIDRKSPAFLSIWRRIPSAEAIAPAFAKLVKTALSTHLGLHAYFREDPSPSKADVLPLIDGYEAALTALGSAKRALQVVWALPQQQESDKAWREARVWLCLRLADPNSQEAKGSLKVGDRRANAALDKAVESTWTEASSAESFENLGRATRSAVKRALRLRLLLWDGLSDVERQRDACSTIAKLLTEAQKSTKLPRARDKYFSNVKDWSALAAGRWLDAFFREDTGIKLEKAIRQQQAIRQKREERGKNGREAVTDEGKAEVERILGLALVCGTGDRVAKVGKPLRKVVEEYDSFRAALAFGSTPSPLGERTDWSSAVKDWRPIIDRDLDKEWKDAFDDDGEAWNRFQSDLGELAAKYKEKDEDRTRRVLGLHLFLRDRTIGALQLPSERPWGDSSPDCSGATDQDGHETERNEQFERVPWTGNIIVEGNAGSGKSTLAVQIALAFTHWPNSYSAIYLALEEGVGNLRAKARELSPEWYGRLCPVAFHDDCEEGSSPRVTGHQLRSLLKQPPECPTRMGKAPREPRGSEVAPEAPASCSTCGTTEARPKVLLPGLSPRSVASRVDGDHTLFWERLQQLERLLTGAEWLRTPEALREAKESGLGPVPEIRLVCIDSLNTFGDRRLTRDELGRLLMLFRRYGVVGLCTVEGGTEAEEMASSDLVDVLINLESENDAGYSLRYLEIAKSRYQHQVYGRHPFKIRREEEVKKEWRGPQASAPRRTLFQAVKIFPSIHHVVAATEPLGTQGRGVARRGSSHESERFRFGIRAIERVLTPLLARNGVLAIVGERNTYKTPIARHFLLYGLSSRETADVEGKTTLRERDPKGRDSVLLVRLHEQTSFDPRRPWMLADDLFSDDRPLIDWESGFLPCGPWIESSKIVQQCFQYAPDGKDGPWLFELALKGGAILPEEFLQFVRNVVRNQPPRYPIRRVVLDDVALIGASYPFLRRSQNAGDLFLSAFVHVMRNYGADLVMLGTKTGLAEADEMVNRACTLADEVLTCEYCDVFGDHYVTLRGGGLASGQEWRYELPLRGEHYEMVPAVIVPKPDNRFGVDLERLGGLAGFGSSRIYRPGLTLRAFEENDLHRAYNGKLEVLVGAAMGTRSRQGDEGGEIGAKEPGGVSRTRPKVEVVTFGPTQNETFHDGLGLMSGQPIDTTIVATVDEFFMTKERRNVFFKPPQSLMERKQTAALVQMRERMRNSKVNAVPYYASVLLLAYKRDLNLRLETFHRLGWKALVEVLEDGDRRLEVDATAPETGACLLLDVLVPKSEDWEYFRDKPIQYLEQLRRSGDLRKHVEEQLEALQKLASKRSEGIGARVLWYSQLRALVSPGGKQTAGLTEDGDSLADSLAVCPLPSGGFTGDWYIGVVDGSVSISLGHKLVAMLCTNKEEYKRLTSGVGLPTARQFYDAGLPAWPGRHAPKLQKLREIHDHARSRATVKDYQAIKPVLYDVWSALQVELMKPHEILDSLPQRIGVLC